METSNPKKHSYIKKVYHQNIIEEAIIVLKKNIKIKRI